jgi:hypothetical protein
MNKRAIYCQFSSGCDGRVVKASDSKSDGVTRTGSNPVRSEFFSRSFLFFFQNMLYTCENFLEIDLDDSQCA